MKTNGPHPIDEPPFDPVGFEWVRVFLRRLETKDEVGRGTSLEALAEIEARFDGLVQVIKRTANELEGDRTRGEAFREEIVRRLRLSVANLSGQTRWRPTDPKESKAKIEEGGVATLAASWLRTFLRQLETSDETGQIIALKYLAELEEAADSMVEAEGKVLSNEYVNHTVLDAIERHMGWPPSKVDDETGLERTVYRRLYWLLSYLNGAPVNGEKLGPPLKMSGIADTPNPRRMEGPGVFTGATDEGGQKPPSGCTIENPCGRETCFICVAATGPGAYPENGSGEAVGEAYLKDLRKERAEDPEGLDHVERKASGEPFSEGWEEKLLNGGFPLLMKNSEEAFRMANAYGRMGVKGYRAAMVRAFTRVWVPPHVDIKVVDRPALKLVRTVDPTGLMTERQVIIDSSYLVTMQSWDSFERIDVSLQDWFRRIEDESTVFIYQAPMPGPAKAGGSRVWRWRAVIVEGHGWEIDDRDVNKSYRMKLDAAIKNVKRMTTLALDSFNDWANNQQPLIDQGVSPSLNLNNSEAYIRGVKFTREKYAQAWADGTGEEIQEAEFTTGFLCNQVKNLIKQRDEMDTFVAEIAEALGVDASGAYDLVEVAKHMKLAVASFSATNESYVRGLHHARNKYAQAWGDAMGEEIDPEEFTTEFLHTEATTFRYVPIVLDAVELQMGWPSSRRDETGETMNPCQRLQWLLSHLKHFEISGHRSVEELLMERKRLLDDDPSTIQPEDIRLGYAIARAERAIERRAETKKKRGNSCGRILFTSEGGSPADWHYMTAEERRPWIDRALKILEEDEKMGQTLFTSEGGSPSDWNRMTQVERGPWIDRATREDDKEEGR